MEKITADVLVVGGGVGGVTAAIQASRYGVTTILATEFSWLGGMLTSAGVAAPDGNELQPWQTGIWGAYLRELEKRQAGGLDRGWVSLFTYHPARGAEIFADWVAQIPNLWWRKNCFPRAVIKKNNRVTGVQFEDFSVEAKIIIDATELGDLLALADVPYRWGWESVTEFDEPSLQEGNLINRDISLADLKAQYPVQAPTWVFLLRDDLKPSQKLDYRGSNCAQFQEAWINYGKKKFFNYGKLDRNLYMVNWPIAGNDYGRDLDRLIGSETDTKAWLREAYEHSYNFASYLQTELDSNLSLAEGIFPQANNSLLPNISSAFAIHPYYRESRRVKGITTITEHDILPVDNGSVAALPINKKEIVDAIAIGNYANDHHYPGINFQLKAKSILWGGRWTGTPFTIPYSALVPEATDGLLVCEKNISVSHIANGSTRLQPVVMNIGQAAGVAAALCIEQNCQPRELNVRDIQEALLTDTVAPAAVIPLFYLTPNHPEWLLWQRYYLEHPDKYLLDGNFPGEPITSSVNTGNYYVGTFRCLAEQNYQITLREPAEQKDRVWQLITIEPKVNQQLLNIQSGKQIAVRGNLNYSGRWLLVLELLTHTT